MLPPVKLLKQMLRDIIRQKGQQGHDVEGLEHEMDSLPDSYDVCAAFALKLKDLPIRPDWPYVEPNDLDAIWKECAPDRPLGAMCKVDLEDSAKHVETAFLASVCGCILGKPLEVNPTLEEIRKAAEAVGEWPLKDYISIKMLEALGRRHGSWKECCRENITYAASDDDLNYTVLGMLLLEKHGLSLNKDHICDMWLTQLPIWYVWGPERLTLIKAAIYTLVKEKDAPYDEWVSVLQSGDEFCGALIRADAYGYACPGRPALAAELAWRDASFTHRRTGIYGTMFTAAAIAVAQVAQDPLEIFEVALKFVPQKSRFYRIAADSLNDVRAASDWLDGYNRIHNKYKEYASCHIYQEIGTVMNTLRFAKDCGDGICKQVSQGNDTDSFGCTCGSILGAYFSPGGLKKKWLKPFQDTIHVGLAAFFEQSLSKLAERMGQLPMHIAEELAKTGAK